MNYKKNCVIHSLFKFNSSLISLLILISFVSCSDKSNSDALVNSKPNTAPVAAAIVPNNFNEDTQSELITLSYSDVEGDLANECTISNLNGLTVTQACACDVAGVCTLKVTGTQNTNGAASFDYTVTANGDVSNTARASISITPINDAPEAISQSDLTMNDNDVLPITLSGNDVDNDSLIYTIVSYPVHGTLSGSAPNFVYHPSGFFSGTDSFTFKVNDGLLDSATSATIRISLTHVIPSTAIYFCNQGSGLWADAGNWFSNSNCSMGSAINRVPITGDYVVISQNSVFSDVVGSITLSGYSGQVPVGDFVHNLGGETANISIGPGGALVVTGGTWGGTSHASAYVKFSGDPSNNYGVINGDVLFDFRDCTSGGACNNSGEVRGNALFLGYTDGNYGHIFGNSEFNTTEPYFGNCGIIDGNAVFRGSSQNGCVGNSVGTVNGNASFFESTINNADGIVNGIASFFENSSNQGGTLNQTPICSTTGACP